MGPAGEFTGEGRFEIDDRFVGRPPAQVPGIQPRVAREHGIGGARVERDALQVIATPRAGRGIGGDDELAMPALGQAVGVSFVVQLASHRRTYVVPDHAAERDGVDAVRSPRAKAKIAPKYRGPKGETWTGRGRAPRWLAALEADGKKRDSYLIKA